MPSAASTPHSTAVLAVREASVTTAVEGDGRSPEQATATHDASAARRTVETVMASVDRYAGEAKAVNLQFSVSGVDLAVHVAMRGDMIHTTFRTDSPELRSALAEQWHAVTGSTDNQPQRLAEPAFVADSAQDRSGNAPQQRDSAERRANAAPSNPSWSRAAASSAESGDPVPATVAALSTSRFLHTFA